MDNHRLLFSGAHGTFTNIDQMLGPKASLNKLQSIKIIQNIFPDHNAEINNKHIIRKFPNTWKSSNTLPNYPWVKRKNHKDQLDNGAQGLVGFR